MYTSSVLHSTRHCITTLLYCIHNTRYQYITLHHTVLHGTHNTRYQYTTLYYTTLHCTDKHLQCSFLYIHQPQPLCIKDKTQSLRFGDFSREEHLGNPANGWRNEQLLLRNTWLIVRPRYLLVFKHIALQQARPDLNTELEKRN
jgi:hypothetical protein